MKCTRCQIDNREGAKFCSEFGYKFELTYFKILMDEIHYYEGDNQSVHKRLRDGIARCSYNY
jgi:hypothetical protein